MKRRPRFAIRTIKDGQVRILGDDYKPTDKWLKYDGRLDGLRYAFGLYWSGDGKSGWYLEPFVYCWGTEQAYHDAELDDPALCSGPELVDGYYPWAHWERVE